MKKAREGGLCWKCRKEQTERVAAAEAAQRLVEAEELERERARVEAAGAAALDAIFPIMCQQSSNRIALVRRLRTNILGGGAFVHVGVSDMLPTEGLQQFQDCKDQDESPVPVSSVDILPADMPAQDEADQSEFVPVIHAQLDCAVQVDHVLCASVIAGADASCGGTAAMQAKIDDSEVYTKCERAVSGGGFSGAPDCCASVISSVVGIGVSGERSDHEVVLPEEMQPVCSFASDRRDTSVKKPRCALRVLIRKMLRAMACARRRTVGVPGWRQAEYRRVKRS